MTKCKQYAVMYNGVSVEYTGYFKTPGAVRKYLKARYSDCNGLTFRAVYPTLEEKIYAVI